MNTDNLDQLSDAALSEAFAVECAGLKNVCFESIGYVPVLVADRQWADPYQGFDLVPPFATSADAVLPFLSANGAWGSDYNPTSKCRVSVYQWQDDKTKMEWHHGHAPTFARAACIALIRAKRATERVHVDQGAHPEDAYAKRAEKGQP